MFIKAETRREALLHPFYTNKVGQCKGKINSRMSDKYKNRDQTNFIENVTFLDNVLCLLQNKLIIVKNLAKMAQ